MSAEAGPRIERLETERLGRRRFDHFPDIDVHVREQHLELVDERDVHRAVDVFEQLRRLPDLRAGDAVHARDRARVERVREVAGSSRRAAATPRRRSAPGSGACDPYGDRSPSAHDLRRARARETRCGRACRRPRPARAPRPRPEADGRCRVGSSGSTTSKYSVSGRPSSTSRSVPSPCVVGATSASGCASSWATPSAVSLTEGFNTYQEIPTRAAPPTTSSNSTAPAPAMAPPIAAVPVPRVSVPSCIETGACDGSPFSTTCPLLAFSIRISELGASPASFWARRRASFSLSAGTYSSAQSRRVGPESSETRRRQVRSAARAEGRSSGSNETISRSRSRIRSSWPMGTVPCTRSLAAPTTPSTYAEKRAGFFGGSSIRFPARSSAKTTPRANTSVACPSIPSKDSGAM